jgi:hypothetical protein
VKTGSRALVLKVSWLFKLLSEILDIFLPSQLLPRCLCHARSFSRSLSPARKRQRRGGRSWSRSMSRSRSRGRRMSRSRSPPRPQRTKEEIAAELAKVSEATRLASLQQQQNTPQALQLSRHARRIYVGGLPQGITEVQLTHYFNQVR